MNSYDLSAPDWAYYPEVEFAAQDDCPYVFGEYVWTGFDYLGELIATDNGDATDLEVFSSCGRNAFSGMAVGIVRTIEGKPGSITVKVTGEGVVPAEITVAVK